MKFKLSINSNIVNKGNPAAHGWRNCEMDASELLAHICKGFAYSPAVLIDGHNGNKPANKDAVEAQILSVDIDNAFSKNERKSEEQGYYSFAEALIDPFLNQFALAVYTTPSHTQEWNRFRIIFLLPFAIKDATQYKLTTSAFIEKYEADAACKDISRLFFGSANCEYKIFGNKLNQTELNRITKAPNEIINETNAYNATGFNGDLTAAQVSYVLSHIPNQIEYNDWFKCISAIGNYFDENTAVSVIESWSPDTTVGTAYRVKHRAKNVHIGTIFYYAKQYGFDTKKFYRELFNERKAASVKTDKNLPKKLVKEALNEESEIEFNFPKQFIFWVESIVNDKPKLTVLKSNLLQYLKYKGIYKFWLEENLSKYVVVENNIVQELTPETIFDILKNDILAFPYSISENFTNLQLLETILQKINGYKSKEFLDALDVINLNFISDTKDSCYFFFKNKIAIADKNANDIIFKNYGELDGFIWKSQIINHDIIEGDKEIANATSSCMFGRFLENVCKGNRDENEPENRDLRKIDYKRLQSLVTAIGYMLHSYKDPTLTKAIILCEEKVSGFDESNGRTGKGLTFQAVSKLRKIVKRDGKSIDFNDRFLFQNVELDTQIFVIDDAAKRFDFELLFSKMTEGLTVEKKGAKAYHIPFERSPKFVISTNYVIPNDSDSFKARKLEIEFSDYYSANYTPIDDFKIQFFNGWDIVEWNNFYLFMMYSNLYFLQNGLIDYDKKNLVQRKFEALGIPFEFEEYVYELLENCRGFNNRVKRSDLVSNFREKNKNHQNKSSKCLIGWFKKILAYKKVEFEERSSNGRYFLISNIPENLY